MSEFVTWLPDVLRAAGVKVEVMPGAETRSTRSSGFSPRGIVWHHTATGPRWSDARVAELLRDGRPDLDGPLSQVGIERDGTFVIVAMGRANHNGYGTWGNDSIGLEFYNDGKGEPWPDVQVDSGVRGTRAILDHLKLPIDRVAGHKETDPTRKIDPTLDMADIRRRIANHQGDDDVTPQELQAALDKQNTWTRQQLNAYHSKTRQVIIDAIADPAEFAKAVAAGLSGVGTSTVTDDQLERVIRKVLGSVDD